MVITFKIANSIQENRLQDIFYKTSTSQVEESDQDIYTDFRWLNRGEFLQHSKN